MTELPGFQATALSVARVRAAESLRPDRLFGDPFAATFDPAFAAEADGRRAPTDRPPRVPQDETALAHAIVHDVVVRTSFLDDRLTEGVAAGCRQVVILAAGLDTRAFRLGWPGPGRVRLFEVDLPDVLAFKERVLGPAGCLP